jgi:glycosyltransferase involved in cell wall biosynthesis
MRFVILAAQVAAYDAVGRDVLAMCELLAARAECYLCSASADGAKSGILLDRTRAEDLLSDPQTVAILQLSDYWQAGEELLSLARGPVVIRYHNITPPDYFVGMDEAWNNCLKGREQVYRFASRYREGLWLSDSHYNMEELGIGRLPVRAVVPPFLHLDGEPPLVPNRELLERLTRHPSISLLMVGRMVPHKGHSLLLDVLAACKRLYGAEVTAWLVGKLDPQWQHYYDSLVQTAQRLGVQDCLRYVGPVSGQGLLSYYLGSDVYISCSNHEGFCVPVVEAQREGLPLVARAQGAVPETAGPGQILLGDDPEDYAHAIHRLCTDESYRAEIAERGRANYEARFAPQRIAASFLAALESYLGQPLRAKAGA